MKSIALILALLASVAFSGCQTSHASSVQMSAGPNDPALVFTLPASIGSERIIEVTENALIRRSWENVSVSGNEVTAHLVHRGIDATLRIEISGSRVSIYSDSWRLDRDGARKSREHPEGWIRNLEKDIRAALGASLDPVD